MCHDHDTGSELAVKQVEVGLLNTATQKVCHQLPATWEVTKIAFFPYNIDTISSIQEMRVEKKCLRGLLVDPIPNYPAK